MNTYRRRKTLNQRLCDFCDFCDDCVWWWDRNRQGVIGGFALGCLVMIIALEFAWRA